MTKPSDTNIDRRFNRDEDVKPPRRSGDAPRPATEPVGSEGSDLNDKTDTDPSTGAPNPAKP